MYSNSSAVGCLPRLLIAIVVVAIQARIAASFLVREGYPRLKLRLLPPSTRSNRLQSTKTTANKDVAILEKFEAWFSSVSSSQMHTSIQHTFFGNLRGLAWTSSSSADLPSSPVVSVPLSIVLQSDILDSTASSGGGDDWDSQLASQLWRECGLGDQSQLSGYCEFLKQGENSQQVPLSTAPNALRHWTQEERTALQQSTAGQNLLELEQSQQDLWKRKYDALSTSSRNDMSLEEFQWAMEVVHSRAFRGNFGSNKVDSDQNAVSSLLPSVLPSLGAAVAGLVYVQTTQYPSDLVLASLGAVAVVPLAMTLLQSSSAPPSAVLLPVIDSANHREDADSTIEYDPLSNCFQMSIGPNCLTTTGIITTQSLGDGEGEGNPQLCVSYGKRSDAELLLNYGFLPGVSCSDNAPLSEQRSRLAEAFNQRN